MGQRSRAALQRYLFYCNRYMNHMQSLRFEHKLYAQVKQKMEEMQQHNMSWIEVQFLKKAVDVLCQCRATLMYTYVFAFYLKKNNQSIIFENNQADLENATEVLSGYLERDISQDSLQDIKQKVQDKYRYCESRRRVLLQHVHEGYEKDLWEYIEDWEWPCIKWTLKTLPSRVLMQLKQNKHKQGGTKPILTPLVCSTRIVLLTESLSKLYCNKKGR